MMPPRFATWLLRRIYEEELLEDVTGDLHEIYTHRLQERGKWIASIHYYKDVILSLRNIGLRRKRKKPRSGSGGKMINSHFKMTFRALRRNRVYAGLNILGLAMGMAAFLFILQYVTYERSYDSFHKNLPDLYRITYRKLSAGVVINHSAVTPPAVAPYMKEHMPEVRKFTRINNLGGLVYSYENKKFREDGTLIVEPDFLELFTFPLLEGNARTALTDINSIVVSQRMARKYFGYEPAVGKVLDIDGYKDYKVTGVIKDAPENSHLQFDFLLSYSTFKFWRGEAAETHWGWLDFYTYVLLEPGTDPAVFDRKFDDLFGRDVRGQRNLKAGLKEDFPLQAVTDIHLHSHLSQEIEPDQQGDANAVFFLTMIAFFILLIALINYINLSTARSLDRAKEVGVRKTIGAFRSQLIHQFMVESMVMNFLGIAIGLSVVIFGIHYFNLWTGSKLDLTFLGDHLFWIRVTAVFVGGSVVSGLYPAFVLSSFQPLVVLKGSFHGRQSGSNLRRVLVVFQFAASVTLIAGTTVVYLQLKHMTTRDPGFERSKIIVVRGPNPVNDEEDGAPFKLHSATFKNELLKYPRVAAVTSSDNVPGEEVHYWLSLRRPERVEDDQSKTLTIWIDENYFSTYGIDVLAGRPYKPEFRSDTASLIINLSAVRSLGFESAQAAIGEPVVFDRERRTIIGVVDNYNQMAVKMAVVPMLFFLEPGAYRFYTIRLSGHDTGNTIGDIQKLYETFYPKAPFDYFFLDEFYDRQYDGERKFSSVFMLFSGFAIFVACLGLFGLSSFRALQRTKEIGIRKVLGAGVTNIVYLLSREFITLVVVGNLIAWPFIYLLMDNWLSRFASRIDLGIPIFLFSGGIVLVVTFITVGYKTVATARSNPVHALKYE